MEKPGTADESPEGVPPTHRLGRWPDFANSSRFHSTPFQRRPVNRSTGPRFHSAPLHRLKSSKTGCPGAMSAAVSPSPFSRQAAHQGLAETSALTAPPKSVRPLPLRASRWPHACPPSIRRRPASHPAVRSRNIAASRPDQPKEDHHRSPSIPVEFLSAKKPWNRHSIGFRQSKYLLASWQVAGSLPCCQSSPGNAAHFGCFLLSQFCFSSEIMQPSSIRIPPRFRFSPHVH